jgi:hypothetical protein
MEYMSAKIGMAEAPRAAINASEAELRVRRIVESRPEVVRSSHAVAVAWRDPRGSVRSL